MEAFEKELQESKSKDTNADEDEDIPDGEHLNDIDDADLGDDIFDRSEAPAGVDQGTEPWLGSDRDYTYQELLTRFYASLHASNPSLLTSTGKRYTIAPPSIHREGNKKSIFANISDICKRMHRQPEHVIQYLFAELGTTGSVDGSGRLVIKGRFQQKQIENVLRRYIGKSLDPLCVVETTNQGVSGICHMQDMQVAGHAPNKRKPYFLHGVRVLRFPAVSERRQDRIPGPGWQA